MNATRILVANIAALLRARGQSQHDLARWCRKSDPWLSDFLAEKKQTQLRNLDRIADFFGLEAYQLFQPGISVVSQFEIASCARSASVQTRSESPACIAGVTRSVL